MSDWIGWASSFILLATIGRQIYKQWSEETSRGVSIWLYAGQFTAQIGFIVYSWQVRNWVFVFTNMALLLENIAGLLIVLHHRQKLSRASMPLSR